MMTPDWQNEENRKRADRLRSLGYHFEVTSDGYMVHFGQKFLGGASVMLPRRPSRGRRTWHKVADLRANLGTAVRLAQQHHNDNDLSRRGQGGRCEMGGALSVPV